MCVECDQKILLPTSSNDTQVDRPMNESIYQYNIEIHIRDFWRWNTFRSYYIFYMLSMLMYTLLYYTFNNDMMIDMTGLLCQLCDGFVALPQALNNYRKKSVKNLR